MRLRILLIIFITLTILACFRDEKNKKDWTIMVYMAADNGLFEDAAIDIDQMEKASFNRQDVNVIVQVDYSEYAPRPEAFRYLITNDRSGDVDSQQLANLGEINSGDPTTLRAFINWCVDKYPADKTALIIWSHGNGWLREKSTHFCPDNESGSYFRITDGAIATALAQSPYLDILIYDACGMQTVEVLTEACEKAKIIIGSEDEVPASGFPYTEILSAWQDFDDNPSLGIDICEKYTDSYLPGGSQNSSFDFINTTCSVIDTKKWQDFLTSFTAFSDSLVVRNASEIDPVRETLYEFNDWAYLQDVDIYQFLRDAQTHPTSAIGDLATPPLAALNEAVIYSQYSNVINPPIGVATIWYPDADDVYNALAARYQKLKFSRTNWYKVIGLPYDR